MQKNLKSKIIFFIFNFVLGITLVMQFNTIQSMNGGQSLSDKATHLQVELNNVRERKAKIEKEIQEVEIKISELRNSEIQADTFEENLKNEIEQYELQLGYKEAIGPGIELELQMQDPETYNILVSNYDLLLSIVNKLNSAGAEGISINDERIVAVTDFKYEKGDLLINSNPVKPPFKLKAIGNADTLEASLNIRYGIIWELKNNYGINSKIEKKELVELPRYTKKIEQKYAEIVEG